VATTETTETGAKRWRRWFVVVGLIGIVSVAAWDRAGRPTLADWYVPPEEVCRRNLEEFGLHYVNWRLSAPGRPERSGTAAFLQFATDGSIPPERLDAFICPGDEHTDAPCSSAERAAYTAIDLDDPATFKGLTSYAIRDFGRHRVPWQQCRLHIIAADRCGPNGRTPTHEGGLNVLYDTGEARFMTWEALGLPLEGPPKGSVIVGPGSPIQDLATLMLPP